MMLHVFRPSVNLINRLRYPQKLMLLGTIVIFIVLALMYELSEQATKQINFSKKELIGIELVKPLFSIINNTQKYILTKSMIVNHLATEDQLQNLKITIEHDMAKFTELLKKRTKNPVLLEQWNQIKKEWDHIQSSQENSSAQANSANVLLNMQKLLSRHCDQFNLTLDPEIDTYYLVDAYCTLIPRFAENISNMKKIGINSLYTKNIKDSDLESLFATRTLIQRFTLPSINENIDKAVNYNQKLKDKFSDITATLNQNTSIALRTMNEIIVLKNFNYSIEEFNKQFSTVFMNTEQLTERMATVITELLNIRINNELRIFYANLIMVIIGILTFIYLFSGVYLSVMQSIRQLVTGSDEIAKGNLSAKVNLESEDELTLVADSFNLMRETLRNLVSELHTVVSAVGNGNLDQRVNLKNKAGFSKELSSNINKMTEVFQEIVQDIITVLDFLSKGNLTIRVTREHHGLFSELKKYVNNTIDTLEKLINSIKNSTKTINEAAEEITLGNADLEKRTEQQAASLEETSASMSRLTENVQKNSENARTAHDFVQTSTNIALEGGKVVNQVVVMMNAINESARQITEITNVIDSIAFQTNILALNAAVEAARAGEQGRGFTVVASEIRNLAQRSSVSAQGIKTLINSSVEKVIEGKKLADEAGKTMRRVVDAVKNVTSSMSEILEASIEQSNGIQQINIAIAEMDQVTQQNSALVEEATRASESLKKQTEKMNELVNIFRISSDKIASTQQSQGEVDISKTTQKRTGEEDNDRIF